MGLRAGLFAVSVCLAGGGAQAQAWADAGGGVASLPDSRGGVAVAGARIVCAGQVWSLAVPGPDAAGAAALVVDGRVFPTLANPDGSIAVPELALAALRSGNRLTLNWAAGGAMQESTFGLTGSRQALDAAAAACPAAAPAPQAAEVTLSLSGRPLAGLPVSIAFTGPGAPEDWIGFAEPGADGSVWIGASWAYVSVGSPMSLPAPATAGTYELRYIRGSDSAILLAVPVTVAAPAPSDLPTATLTGQRARAGSVISVELPDARRTPGDYLYIAPAGAGDQDYSGGYVSIPTSGPATITAPATPGDWELRYMIPAGNGQYIVIGRAPLKLD